MKKTIISAGSKTDIDVLACAVAYKNILGLIGKEVFAVISKDFGGTIPEIILNRGFTLDEIQIENNDEIIIVDMSEPKYIDTRVNQDKIIEIWDHHPGYEQHRQEKLGDKAIIEHIGACATLIYEQAEKYKITEKLEKYSIDLLLTAILSNTLNFKAKITKERDRKAYEKLRSLSTLPENWSEIYFKEVEKDITANPEKSIINDTKVMQLFGTNVTIAQIELRKSYDFMEQNKDTIEKTMLSYGYENWVYTSPSIGEGINNLFTKSDLIKKALTEKIGAHFTGDFGTTDTLWLRKEIWKICLS